VKADTSSDEILLDAFFWPNPGVSQLSTELQRSTWLLSERHELLIDGFERQPARCIFFRSDIHHANALCFAISGEYTISACASGGWLVLPVADQNPAYWLPQTPKVRRLDSQGHILSESDAPINDIRVSPTKTAISFVSGNDSCLEWVVWRIDADGGDIIESLANATCLETQRYYLWGSHTHYRRPADLYLHLIHGKLYENNFAWPHRRKICSENDAHALYVTLCGLERATGKRIYSLLKEQVLRSVLLRQSADGAWYHGSWTNHMECHYRLHCSGMHLLMDALVETKDEGIREALSRAADFISRQTDTIDGETWFLHDDLERSADKMREGPFRWVSSRALGKSPTNMVVLNTHLDTTIALDRYRYLTGDAQYELLVASARRAVVKLMRLKPAEWLYRPLFDAINLTFLPTPVAERLPLPARAIKRIAWKYLIPQLPRIKSWFPRLAMPGGYIDRELTLKTWAHNYQTINLMDLLRFARRFPEDGNLDVVEQGLRFVQDSGIRARWKEIPQSTYALGFWAEALYHACTLRADDKYRHWLVEAMLDLHDLGLGIPPSLLGANAEAIEPPEQAACPLLGDRRLLIANLGRAGNREFLVVNAAHDALPLTWGTHTTLFVDEPPKWYGPGGEPRDFQEIATIPGRSWLRAM
jgi:hypothetical protein